MTCDNRTCKTYHMAKSVRLFNLPIAAYGVTSGGKSRDIHLVYLRKLCSLCWISFIGEGALAIMLHHNYGGRLLFDRPGVGCNKYSRLSMAR